MRATSSRLPLHGRPLSHRRQGFTLLEVLLVVALIGILTSMGFVFARDLVPQYLKLAMKARAGADLAITQVGSDTRSWSELLGWNATVGPGIPVMASIYMLSGGAAKVFHTRSRQ